MQYGLVGIVHVIPVTSYNAKLVPEGSFKLSTEARIGVVVMMILLWGATGSNINPKRDLASKDHIQWPFPVSALWRKIPTLSSFRHQNSSMSIILENFCIRGTNTCAILFLTLTQH